MRRRFAYLIAKTALLILATIAGVTGSDRNAFVHQLKNVVFSPGCRDTSTSSLLMDATGRGGNLARFVTATASNANLSSLRLKRDQLGRLNADALRRSRQAQLRAERSGGGGHH